MDESVWRGGIGREGEGGIKCRERPKMPGAAELTSHHQLFPPRHTALKGTPGYTGLDHTLEGIVLVPVLQFIVR